MKGEKLAPLEWPVGYAIPMTEATSIGNIFADVPSRIRAFLHEALKAGYLPAGVQMALAVIVTPINAELNFIGTGIVAADHGHLRALMAAAADWNKQHRRSFFQRFTTEYTGTRGAAAVFKRFPNASVDSARFHVAQFTLRETAMLAGPLRKDQGDFEDLHLEAESAVRVEADHSPWESHLGAKAKEDRDFTSLVGDIARDKDYLGNIRAIIPYSNLVLADPRSYFGAAEFQQRMGGLGLNVLLHPEVEITNDLIVRIFLLADRLNVLLHMSSALYFDGENTGAYRAFRMVTHSLGNAVKRRPQSVKQAEAILKLELWNMQGAELLTTRTSLSPSQLVCLGRGELASVLDLALPRDKNDHFSYELTCLDGLAVDPRFLALLLELARNQRRKSTNREGVLSVTLPQRGWAAVVCTFNCSCVDASNLAKGLNTDVFVRPLIDLHGLQILLLLLDLLCTKESHIAFEIGAPPFVEQCSFTLPNSEARASLRFSADVQDELNSNVAFQSTTRIEGIIFSGG